MTFSRSMVLTLAVLTMAGCKADPAVEKGELVNRGTKNPVPPPAGEPMKLNEAAAGPVGEVMGTVLLNGKPPVMASIDTSMDPACGFGGKKFTAEQFVGDPGKLGNVFVYVKSGPAAAMAAAPATNGPVVMDQKGCRYIPHVVGVLQGGFIEFHNSDSTMHNIHTMPTDVGNETIDVSQGPKGAPQAKQFLKPELMIPVRCNNHPWMNAFINVSATPFFVVTDASGKFDLKGLPAGDYVLGAVHEKLGEKTLNVHIDANKATKADVGFSMK